ncbi:hypothetical protein [Nostoc sp. 'Peltigera membranacea cyanobiont' 232]|nr:hypothetical protein [Nostoc sp. 'Peltigera membranacea cyanobiont' 232]
MINPGKAIANRGYIDKALRSQIVVRYTKPCDRKSWLHRQSPWGLPVAY